MQNSQPKSLRLRDRVHSDNWRLEHLFLGTRRNLQRGGRESRRSKRRARRERPGDGVARLVMPEGEVVHLDCEGAKGLKPTQLSKGLEKFDQREFVRLGQVGSEVVASIEDVVGTLADLEKVGDQVLHDLT